MSYLGKSIAVVVPAYNEEKLIGRVISGMPEFVDRIIVVDDASVDGTAQAVRNRNAPKVNMLQHFTRRGVGASIRTGYEEALKKKADVIAVMAGDGQMAPEDLHRIIEPVARGRADYVKGNRLYSVEFAKPMPLLRKFGNRLLELLTQIALLRRDVHDPQCGYTAISSSALVESLRFSFCDGYGYPNIILCNLTVLRKRIKEVPARAVYGDEKSGIVVPVYALKMILILAACFFRRLEQMLKRLTFRSTQ
jgi:glycosyltransferase involved in cell wall biosynthesis